MKRRTLLQTMAAGSVAAIVPTRAMRDDECEIHAKALADALHRKHGYQWKIQFDGMNEFVLLYREVKPRA